jgi:hypothetical protein
MANRRMNNNGPLGFGLTVNALRVLPVAATALTRPSPDETNRTRRATVQPPRNPLAQG